MRREFSLTGVKVEENTVNQPKPARGKRVRDFASDEDGAIIIFCLIIFMGIVAVSGMAFDIMRHEQVRTQLQTVADNATLAAANLNNSLDPDTVVRDYFEKAGLTDHLGGLVDTVSNTLDTRAEENGGATLTGAETFAGFNNGVLVQETVNSRRVTATAGLTIGTTFMKMSGIDTLDVHVVSTARQDAGDIEISMVLDVSGSMVGTKEARMRTAATQFVNTVLPDVTVPIGERPTVSIVPYNDMVNLGSTASSHFSLEDTHDYSHCARLPSDSFTSVDLPVNAQTGMLDTIERIGHFDRWTEDTSSPISRPQCPTNDLNTVLLHSADPSELNTHIAGLAADSDGWTAISLGAKFGVALLDPSTRGVTNSMHAAGLLNDRAEDLPKDYKTESGASNTKVLVLMTDGANTRQYDLKSQFKTGNSNVYYANVYKNYFNNGVSAAYSVYVPSRASQGRAPWYFPYYDNYYWSNPFDSWGVSYYRLSNAELFNKASIEHIGHEIYAGKVSGWSDYIYYSNGYPYSRAHEIYIYDGDLDTQTRNICDAAKNENITIYAVAFSAPSGGRTLMSYCASSAAHYFEVDNDSIVLAFEAIGRNINQLKLTQ